MAKLLKYSIFIATLLVMVYCHLFLMNTTVSAKNVTLLWDANTEPDLAGYKAYYDADPGIPYAGAEATEGSSPVRIWVNGKKPTDPEYANDLELTDNANPEITLSGLVNEDDHYFTVTAFDDETPALESDYSNEVTAGPEEVEDFFEIPTGPMFMTSEAVMYLRNVLKDWSMV